MANREIEAILKISAKMGNLRALGVLNAEMRKVNGQIRKINRSQTLMAAASARMAGGMTMAAGAATRYLAPALATLGAGAAVKSFATIERRMARIGMTAEASSEETAKALEIVRQTADDLKVPVDNVVEGLDSLVASGKTMQEALAFLPSVAGTAHAADAAFSDMATTADAVSVSFKIVAGGMERAFDILAKGGKAGKFELKDMASELPSLAPAFAALGYRGEAGLKRLVAALQTVRLETGTSGEAATAFMDVLTKMQSSAITSNFKKMGVDLRRELARSKAAGEDVIEGFIRITEKALRGDMSKLPLLFTDKQMLIGMRALMNHTQEFAGFMKELGDATGTVRADLQRLAGDAQSSLDKIGNSWTRLKQSIGSGLVDLGASDLMDRVSNSIDYASAVNRGLEQNGVNGFFARSVWGMTHSDIEKRQMARFGGFRTPDERRYAAYGAAYGKAIERARLEAALPPDRPRDENGMPIHPPLPTPRPISPSEQERAAAAWASGRDAYRPATPTSTLTERDEADMRARYFPEKPMYDLSEAENRMAGAGRAFREEAARAANEIGEQGGSTFAKMLEGLGARIGREAAQAFKAGVGAIDIRPRPGAGVSGDIGQMPPTGGPQ